jgi:hypothetical protein
MSVRLVLPLSLILASCGGEVTMTMQSEACTFFVASAPIQDASTYAYACSGVVSFCDEAPGINFHLLTSDGGQTVWCAE